MAELTNHDILVIYSRSHSGHKRADIAADYGIAKSTVSDIKNGNTHTHITRRAT